jgi:hypothetical protein
MPSERSAIAPARAESRWVGWRFPALVAAGFLVLPAAALVREMFAAGGCVERGGSYDYLRALCYLNGQRALGGAAGATGPLFWVALALGFKLAGVVGLLLFRNRLGELFRRFVVQRPVVLPSFSFASRRLAARPVSSEDVSA